MLKFRRIVSVLLTLIMLMQTLPMSVFATTANENSETEPLAGKTLSILGASISTYADTSNGDAAETTNSTIRDNAKYYPSTTVLDVSLSDTWWMQAANDLGLRLLVNNSWSGSSLLYERSGTVGAYVDRCVQLHDDTGDNAGETPDIIAIQMGTNDFQYYKDTLGTADIDYDTLIVENNDGTYTYSTPVTSLEAAAIVLHKISVRYPNAEVYYLNISQRIDGTDELIQSFNAELKQVVEYFDAHIVDIYGSAITMDDFSTYIGDNRVHPNKLGMDAYTEAFKRSILANTAYTIDTHTVSFDLNNVTADYGDNKIVTNGQTFQVNLTPKAGETLNVSVVMGNEDITATAYNDGLVSIASVTDDVIISAESVHTPQNYRWEFDGTDLVSAGETENALTRNAGTTTDGVFDATRYALDIAIVLRHDLPWVVEWKCEGTFQNTGSSSGARVFSTTEANADYGARYVFKSNKNGLIAMGEKTSSGSHNYGIALADYNIDWTQLHTYRLENRIAQDGSNMIWLFVDDIEIGPMNNYYVGTTDKDTTSDWLSGKDFIFPYMGTDTHGFTNAAIEYIQVSEYTHNYTPLSKQISIRPGQLDPDSDGTILDNDIYGCVVNYDLKKGHTLSISDESYVFSVRRLMDNNYSTMLKQATTASFTATEDMTVGMLIRKPDKSTLTAEELSEVTIIDSRYNMIGVDGYEHAFTVEAETIDGGTATTRAAIFLPDSYSENGNPTRLIIMTNGYHAHLTDSVWNANTDDDVGVMKHYLDNDYAVIIVDNTNNGTTTTPDWGNPQLVSSYWKAYEYVQAQFNVEELFSIHSRSMGTFAAIRLMREHPELVKCAVMCGPVLSLKSRFSTGPAFLAKRYGFDDLSGATWEADKVVGYDPYTDVNGLEYDLPPTFWMLAESDATTAHLSTIEKIKNHGNDVSQALYTETDHSGVCRLNIEACRTDSLAFLEKYQETTPEHRFCAWNVTAEATCTEAGEMRRYCADCEHYESMEIPALSGHMFESSETVCDVCGMLFDIIHQEIEIIPGQFYNESGEWLASDIYGCVIGYELKAGHTLSISDTDYVFAVRVWKDGSYATMVKEATSDVFVAEEDMTIAVRVRKPDKSALTEDELANIVLNDNYYAEHAHTYEYGVCTGCGEKELAAITLGDFVVAGVSTTALSSSNVLLSQKTLIAVPYCGAELSISVNGGYQVRIHSGDNHNNIDQVSDWLNNGDCYVLPESSIYMRVSVQRADGGQITAEELTDVGIVVSYICGSDIVADNAEAVDIIENTELPVIIHLSDIHGDTIRAGRAAYFADAVGADALIASGDLTAYEPDDWGNALFDTIANYPNVNFIYGIGNHDAKVSASAYQEKIYQSYYAENPLTPDGETYYFQDIVEQKLRIISVNQQEGASTTTRGGTCYSQEQVDWLVEVLQTTPAGYGVMLMYHSPETAISNAVDVDYSEFFQTGNRYDNSTNNYSGYSGTFLMDLVDAFMLRENFSWSYSEQNGASPVELNADFTGVAEGVEFIAHVTGHLHSDSVIYLPGTACKQLLLGVTCTNSMYGEPGGYYGLADYSDLERVGNTASQDAFNAYVIDRENKTVRILRVGARETVNGLIRDEMTIPYSVPFEEGEYLFDTEGLVKLDLEDVEWVNYGYKEYGLDPSYMSGVRYTANAVFDVPYDGVTFFVKINAPYEMGIRSGVTADSMKVNGYWLTNKVVSQGSNNIGYCYTIPAGHTKFMISFGNITRNNQDNSIIQDNLINSLELKASGIEIWYLPENSTESVHPFSTEDKTKLDLSDVEWVNYGYKEYGAEPTYLPGVRLTTNSVFDVPYEGVTFYIKINAPYELGIRSGETDTTMTTNCGWLNNKYLSSGDSNYGYVYTIPEGHEKFVLTIGNVTRDSSNNVITSKTSITLEELETAGLEIWYVANHTHSYEGVVIPPSCVEQGYTSYSCSVCGDTYTDSFVDALGHSFEAGICLICGAQEPTDDSEIDDESANSLSIVFIGNSYANDSADWLYSILRTALDENISIKVATLTNSSRTMGWHATQAKYDLAGYRYRYINDQTKSWKQISDPLCTSQEVLMSEDWDVVILQPSLPEGRTGYSGNSFGETEEFLWMKDSVPYMLDYIHGIVPDAKIYYHIPWATFNDSSELNGNVETYDKIISITKQFFSVVGTETEKSFDGVIPAGTAVQNARTTYLALQNTNKNVKESIVGLQRDAVHLNNTFGKYTVALTYALYLFPEEVSAAITALQVPTSALYGTLPTEYTEIIKQAAVAAVDNPCQITEIVGHEEDPTVAAGKTLSEITLGVPCTVDKSAVSADVLATLPADFVVDAVVIPEEHEESFSVTVTIRFGYTSLTVDVACKIDEHEYIAEITTPTCTEQGYTTYTCTCGDSYVADHVAEPGHAFVYTDKDGLKLGDCSRCDAEDVQIGTPIWHIEDGKLSGVEYTTGQVLLALYNENGQLIAVKFAEKTEWTSADGIVFYCFSTPEFTEEQLSAAKNIRSFNLSDGWAPLREVIPIK